MANDDLMTWNYSESLIGDGQASMVEVVGDKIYIKQCESDSRMTAGRELHMKSEC